MQRPARALAAAILIAGPTALAFFSGGFFERPRLIAAIAVWCVAALVAVVADHPLPRTAEGRAAVAALALLTLWTGLSYEWAPLGERAQADAQRLLLYLGFFTAAVAVLRGRAIRRALEPGLALGTLVIALYGLSERLLPGLVELDRSRAAEGRLEQPLTYWNAMGCLTAVGLLLCMRLAGDTRRRPALRAAAAVAGPVLALGAYLTFSRGALAALVGGVALLAVLSPARRDQLRAIAVIATGGIVASFAAALLPAVESLARGESGSPAQGAVMIAALTAVGLAAAVANTHPRSSPVERGPRARRTPGWAVAILALGAVAAAAAIETPSSRPAGDPTGVSHFGSADTVRYGYWRTALDAFADDPLKGAGSGGFAVAWRKEEDRDENAVDAHSLYIETLAELGLVGAAILVAWLAAVARASARAHRRDPAAAAGLAAALFAWALHAGIDWDWEMPAVTGIALALAAALVALDDDARSESSASSA